MQRLAESVVRTWTETHRNISSSSSLLHVGEIREALLGQKVSGWKGAIKQLTHPSNLAICLLSRVDGDRFLDMPSKGPTCSAMRVSELGALSGRMCTPRRSSRPRIASYEAVRQLRLSTEVQLDSQHERG